MASVAEGFKYSISGTEFFNVWRQYPKELRNAEIYTYILRKSGLSNVSKLTEQHFKNKIRLFSQKINDKWQSSGKRIERFNAKYEKWLEESNIVFEIEETESSFQLDDLEKPSTSYGRPKKLFEESSDKTKKRKIKDIVESKSPQEVALAAEVLLRKSGQRDAASLVKEVTTTSPKRASKIKRIRASHEKQRSFTPDEALALYIDMKSTSHAYKLMRKKAAEVGHYIYPSFYSLRKAKEACCPPEETIKVDEISASVKLQSLLDHTAKRILKTVQPSIIQEFPEGVSLTLISKWGCDGSSGHSQYKQRFQRQDATDEFLFLISFVPLKLITSDAIPNIIWENPKPSSTRYCRPIKFIFEKETETLAKRECEIIVKQIETLLPTSLQHINIKHMLLQTMIDGKMVNILTDTRGSQVCYICGAKPSEMNTLSEKQSIATENYGYGLSTLHAWIKTFECLLHIGYRLNLKVWQVRSIHKDEYETRKKEIQTKFRNEMGLHIDKPKPGFGTTNDGNTARTFFRKAADSARITGVDEGLIKKFYVILSTLSSGHEINVEKFKQFTYETKELYLNLYSWFYLPVTVHKILTHGAEVIKSCIVPIGHLSEEAQEARNKDCRRFRELHTRKCSRGATNRDLLTMLLITSDPLINTFRDIPKQNIQLLSEDILELLNISTSAASIPPSHTQNVEKSDIEDYLLTDSTDVDESDNEDFIF